MSSTNKLSPVCLLKTFAFSPKVFLNSNCLNVESIFSMSLVGGCPWGAHNRVWLVNHRVTCRIVHRPDDKTADSYTLFPTGYPLRMTHCNDIVVSRRRSWVCYLCWFNSKEAFLRSKLWHWNLVRGEMTSTLEETSNRLHKHMAQQQIFRVQSQQVICIL